MRLQWNQSLLGENILQLRCWYVTSNYPLTFNFQMCKIIILIMHTFYFVACSAQPVLFLMVVSWVIVGLCIGISYLEVTTDPVELWSSPTSEVRQQKDYYDTR